MSILRLTQYLFRHPILVFDLITKVFFLDRTDGWFLMSSPLPTIFLCVSNVYIVKVWGPNYMKNREPLNIKNFLIIYNFLQVILSTYIFVQVSI